MRNREFLIFLLISFFFKSFANDLSKDFKVRKYNNKSKVEEIALKQSKHSFCYSPTEKIGIIQVDDFPSLGKLIALRFLEWLQLNPGGLVSLPTGKTPEFFIKWTTYFLNNWNDENVQKELAQWGLDPSKKPDMLSFHFVQIDEFYPMNPEQLNSFAHYIDKFYFKEFGLDSNKALLMDTWKVGAPANKDLGYVFSDDKVDLNLRFRYPETELEKRQRDAILAIDQFAMEYEQKIKVLGGIGFFLGGIGPDGHIGFNIKGSDHFSTTRLSAINYETAAAAASDLGGIEISRNKVVVTIGLKTITQNETATAIIIAAGEAKAKIIKNAIEEDASVLYPATSLHKLKGARFYLTNGAACGLIERKFNDLKKIKDIPQAFVEHTLIDIANKKDKALIKLVENDIAKDYLGSILLEQENFDLYDFINKTEESLKYKIKKGFDDFVGKTFLHTSPHHDDVMLAYFPYMVHLVRNSKSNHYFATMTSGFTSVSNDYTLNQILNLEKFIKLGTFDSAIEQDDFSLACSKMFCFSLSGRSGDVYHYLDGVAANNLEKQERSEAWRMLRNFTELFGINLMRKTDLQKVSQKINELKKYFKKTYPGKKDSPDVQKLKGMIREWEEELLWGHLGFNCDHIFHLRLGFYTGDIFTQQPEWERDIKPILNLLQNLNPDIVTVALDPEGSGPDTHYKVLQATSKALMAYLKERPNKKIKVWGYRNVWYRFNPADSDIFVPVSMNSLAILNQAFNTCFGSQRAASFPSYEHDGPFSELAQKIMVEQYKVIRTCLGEDYFHTNPIPRLRATRGFCFLKSMTPQEFFEQADLLKKRMESKVDSPTKE